MTGKVEGICRCGHPLKWHYHGRGVCEHWLPAPSLKLPDCGS